MIIIAEIEGFHNIVSILSLAKKLHDIGRFDVVGQFYDSLCLDSYFDHMLNVISSIFVGFECKYVEENETELMKFEDDLISDYFVHAWEYGQLHKIHYSQNPYVIQAQSEAQRCLNGNCCVDWKLLAYIRTKKAAQKSELFVCMSGGCGGCCGHEKLAHGLIQLYTWFKNKCDEFEASPNNSQKDEPLMCAKSGNQEVMAA